MSAFGFPIRIPPDLLDELGTYTGHYRSLLDLEPIICGMIRDYMAPPPAAEPEQPTTVSDAGYQWKETFLPAGTKLRSSFNGKPYYAVVQGAEIRFGESAVSPSGFANLQGSGNRNAWKTIWLRLPGSNDWLLADVCRSARKAAIARLMAGEAPQAGQPACENGASVPDDGDVARNPGPPRLAGAKPGPRKPARSASSAPQASAGNDVQRKKNTSRAARRKRRAAKNLAATP